jgi:hypothetical protein
MTVDHSGKNSLIVYEELLTVSKVVNMCGEWGNRRRYRQRSDCYKMSKESTLRSSFHPPAPRRTIHNIYTISYW